MSLLLKVKPLVISPELASRIGLNEAIVLQQICYWLEDTTSGVEHDGRRWVYNTIEEWTQQFPFWSEKTVKRALTSLKNLELIYVEQLKKTQHDRTNYYAINHRSPLLSDGDKLTPSRRSNCRDRKGQIDPMERVNLGSSNGSTCPDLTENTTETTTEITKDTSCPVAAQPDPNEVINSLAKQVLLHLNQVTGAKFQMSDSSLANVRARLADGHTADELQLVVDYKHEHWHDTEQDQYLRPKTLFTPSNFPGYLKSATKWERNGRPDRSQWNTFKSGQQRDINVIPQSVNEIPDGFRGA